MHRILDLFFSPHSFRDVLPDVWIKYGANPGKRFELLLTPHSRSGAAAAAQALRF